MRDATKTKQPRFHDHNFSKEKSVGESRLYHTITITDFHLIAKRKVSKKLFYMYRFLLSERDSRMISALACMQTSASSLQVLSKHNYPHDIVYQFENYTFSSNCQTFQFLFRGKARSRKREIELLMYR